MFTKKDLTSYALLTGSLAGFAISSEGDVYTLIHDSPATIQEDEKGLFFHAKGGNHYIHDLMYRVFVENKDGYIIFKDGDKRNLALENMTKLDQVKGRPPLFGEDKVREIKSKFLDLKKGGHADTPAYKMLAEVYGTSYMTMFNLVRGRGAYQAYKHITGRKFESGDFVLINNKSMKTNGKLAKVAKYHHQLDKYTVVTVRDNLTVTTSEKNLMKAKIRVVDNTKAA